MRSELINRLTKNINPKGRSIISFSETDHACVNKAGIDTLDVRNFLHYG